MSGLMSDPEKRNKLFAVISKRQSVVSVILFFGGLGAFAGLAYVDFAQKTYFSENALLPGVVDETFSSADKKLAEDLIYQASLRYGNVTLDTEPILAPWLMEQFESFGLEAYQQKFTLSYPVHGASSHNVFQGANVYGILRAPRSSGHEGIAILAPIRTTGPYLQSNAAGIGLLLAMAKFFSERNFWARDIAFVVPAMDMYGTQAWLNAYSALPPLEEKSASSVGVGSDFLRLEASPLEARCGALQAALVLELGPNPNPPRFDLRLEGVNGLLPNLDLVNLVVRVSEKHGIPISLQNRTDARRLNTLAGFTYSLQTLVKQMGALAQFSPTGLHGLFLPLRVEALTMASEPPRPSKRMQAAAADLLAVGRLMEAIVRSLNNLQERFHQSFFFYLLPCTHFFLSIGPYMGAFGAILAAPLLHALALWITARSTSPSAKSDDAASTPETTPAVPPISPVWPYLIASLIAGTICYSFIPHLWLTSISTFGLTAAQGMLMSILSLVLTFVFFLPRSPLFKKNGVAGFPDWRLAKSVALLFCTLMLGALSLVNFSFAFFSALLLIPTAVFAKPSDSRIVRLLRLGMIIAIGSPLTLSFVLVSIHPTAPSGSSIGDEIGVLFAKALNDYYIHGSRFWLAFSLAYFPAWVFLYMIPLLPLNSDKKSDSNKSENSNNGKTEATAKTSDGDDSSSANK